MDGNGEARLDHFLRRVGRVPGRHHEVPADRNHHQVRLVVRANHGHVAEQAGVAHVVDLEAVTSNPFKRP